MKKYHIFFLIIFLSFLCIIAIAFFPLFDREYSDTDINLNIILITVDALRSDSMSCYGYKYETCPKIDEFSKRSLLFKNAYCTIPKTSASIASIMTGLHPYVHKTRPTQGPLAYKNITLAEALRLKGYYNYACVDNANLSKVFQFNQGFNKYIEVWENIDDKKESTRYITEKGIQFLSKKRDTPFFLWLHYMETHTPYMPPEKYVEQKYKGRDITQIKNKIVAGTTHERTLLKDHPFEGYFTSLYEGAIKYADEEIGRIIDVFYKKSWHENTLFIISSDHGEDIGEYNYFFNHGKLTFSPGIRVPIIAYLPDFKPQVITRPVSLMDIYPTILHIAGLQPHQDIQGISLLRKHKKRLLYIIGSGSFAVITKNGYHFTYLKPETCEELKTQNRYLFNFFNDPNEKNNIITKHRDLSERLEKKYNEYRSIHNYLNSHKKTEEAKKLSEKALENLRTLGYIK